MIDWLMNNSFTIIYKNWHCESPKE